MIRKISNKEPSDLSLSEAEQELNWLYEELEKHNRAYHQNDNPMITDFEYDSLYKRNEKIEKLFPHLVHAKSYSNRVGALAKDGFAKVEHEKPMLSLNNAFSEKDIFSFFKRVRRFLKLSERLPIEVVGEPKIDGLSVSARYQSGHFVSAATRGDGIIGENITENLLTISNLPTKLSGGNIPNLFEVRREVYISKDNFSVLNKEQEQKGEKIFSNPRNAAAGSLRQLDSKVTKTRPLSIFFYASGVVSEKISSFHSEYLKIIKDWGFSVNPLSRLCKTEEEVLYFYKEISELRNQLDYDIDGLVFKVNRLDWQERMGAASKAPRWAIAYKFGAESSETRLNKISIQVGRTGALTPVANLVPVTIGGVQISRASLHNEDEIIRLDVREGDCVMIHRAGDVIPKITSVNFEKRPYKCEGFNFPTKCPECGSAAVREEGTVVRRCVGGLICPAQVVERLKHFVSKNAFDIQGLGDKNVEDFFGHNLIKTPSDIFLLERHRNFIDNLEGWGTKSIDRLFAAINERAIIELPRFIFSLGIPQIGQTLSRTLAIQYGDIDSWLAAMISSVDRESEAFSNLIDVEGIGPMAAEEIAIFFEESRNQSELKHLLQLVDVKNFSYAHDLQTVISGKTIVFTGKLDSAGRSESRAVAEFLGAKVAGTISRNTDFLVAGAGDGSKLKKANQLGVEILLEDDWNLLISAEKNKIL